MLEPAHGKHYKLISRSARGKEVLDKHGSIYLVRSVFLYNGELAARFVTDTDSRIVLLFDDPDFKVERMVELEVA